MFIELTLLGSSKENVMFNVQNIVEIKSRPGSGTLIFTTESTEAEAVAESYEQVKNAIRGSVPLICL